MIHMILGFPCLLDDCTPLTENSKAVSRTITIFLHLKRMINNFDNSSSQDYQDLVNSGLKRLKVGFDFKK